MFARDVVLGKKFRHKTYDTTIFVTTFNGTKVFLDEDGYMHHYVDSSWYEEVNEPLLIGESENKLFYKDCLLDLRSACILVESILTRDTFSEDGLYELKEDISKVLEKVENKIQHKV